MTVDPNDIDQLIAAIRSLRSSLTAEILVPAASGVIGVIAGFFLSIAKTGYDRRARRRDEITGAVRNRRQAAVETFSAEAKWISRNPGYFGSATDWAPHYAARRTGPEQFSKTGKVSDELVTVSVRHYLQQLDDTIKSYARPVDNGPVDDYSGYPGNVSARVIAEVKGVREAAQKWVDDDRDSDWLSTRLDASRARVRALLFTPPDPTPAAGAGPA